MDNYVNNCYWLGQWDLGPIAMDKRCSGKVLSRYYEPEGGLEKTIVLAVGELSGFPQCVNVKRLSNHPYEYRLRVGRYRIFFDFHSQVRIIRIEEVKKRDERTY